MSLNKPRVLIRHEHCRELVTFIFPNDSVFFFKRRLKYFVHKALSNGIYFQAFRSLDRKFDNYVPITTASNPKGLVCSLTLLSVCQIWHVFLVSVFMLSWYLVVCNVQLLK